MKIFCFEIRYIGFPNSWKKLARQGNKIGAIGELRQKSKKTIGLLEGKEIVEAYMNKVRTK